MLLEINEDVLVKESRAGTCEVRICPHVKGSIIINDAAGCHKENLSQWRGHLVVGKNVTVRDYGFNKSQLRSTSGSQQLQYQPLRNRHFNRLP
jgi:hypothetical protein